jgi:hypothetical protein
MYFFFISRNNRSVNIVDSINNNNNKEYIPIKGESFCFVTNKKTTNITTNLNAEHPNSLATFGNRLLNALYAALVLSTQTLL